MCITSYQPGRLYTVPSMFFNPRLSSEDGPNAYRNTRARDRCSIAHSAKATYLRLYIDLRVDVLCKSK